MGRINKIDYFVGVFLSTILSSSKGIPALFDEGVKDSKRVEFETDSGCFNVYIKYSTNQRTANVRVNGEEKKKVSWDITFSNRDYYILKNQFEKKDKINLVCLICTNEKLNGTHMAVLKYSDAMKCLQKKTISGSRRITVTRTGAERSFYCYGVEFDEKDYIKCPVDYTHFLGLKEEIAENV